jgi:hypothetical protein
MQDTLEYTNGYIYMVGAILAMLLALGANVFGYRSDKVVISKDLKITVDTIYSKESRWYYDNDTTSAIRVEIYSNSHLLPYEVLYLEAGDYVDLKLDTGNNRVLVRNPHSSINFSTEKGYTIYQVAKK